MEYSFLFLFVLSTLSLLLPTTTSHPTVFNVLHYGAVGDGQTDDTNAFAKAWKQTCAVSSSSVTLRVPSHKTFLIRPLKFYGPCNSKTVTVEVYGNLVAPYDPSDWRCEHNICGRWIHFHGLAGLTVRGHGRIDGSGARWWRTKAFEISDSDNVHIGGGLRFKDSPRMHIVLNGIRTLSVSNVTIDAPEQSPNTDGIHVTGCTNVVIDHSRIGTGDDCISIVDGSSFVTVSNVVCGPGHGISIGSLGKNGANDKVEHVRVSDAVFLGAQNGARIKTWQGGRGHARHIMFERILYHDTTNPIIIDQFYCDHQHCRTKESAVQIKNVTFRQIVGTSRMKTAVILKCSKTFPCTDIVVEDMHILTTDEHDATFECKNVLGIAQGKTVPGLSCLDLV
ncbi:putative polygalacturonase [Sesamum alatum]|uniref:Polygalacturonase n=1 Tax=Sesamum alatum TaxID=300844 RepID=A0AAE1YUP2_9LAMI|nr:putative polygalacturonase [Sesamum alatum]